MSEHPQSKLLSKLSRRRKQFAFLVVAAATFFCLSMIWPLSTRSWRSESEISLQLTQREDSGVEFKKLLTEVVKRHTSVDSIARALDQNGIEVDGANVSSDQLALELQQRLNVVLFDQNFDPDDVSVRVGLEGEATEKDNFFVNMLATTIAKDFMTSPLAGILPTDPLPAEDINSIRIRRTEIEYRATELLAQIQTNLTDSANDLVQSGDEGLLLLDDTSSNQSDQLTAELKDLISQRQRIALSEGDSTLELSAIDQQIDEVQRKIDGNTSDDGPFHMASHTLNKVSTGNNLKNTFASLRETISDLANVTAEACTAAEAASRTQPAFTISSVQGRAPVPVGAIPSGRELLFLTLASCVFATIVSLAYQPFAQRGFESVDDIGKKLKLPVIATLESRNEFEEVTGTGIPAESVKADTPGSNQVVNVCKWILFCGLMLTIGFCLVNSEIMDAFMVSPFHGFAQIVWTLKGN